MKIRLVTVAWGSEFIDLFIRTGLRTLLGSGNVPDLAKAHQVIYSFHTTPDGVERLEANRAFQKLRQSVDLRPSIFQPNEIDGSNPASHSHSWEHAIEAARHSGEIVFFVIPDVLYGKGTFMRWASRFEQGAGAISSLGPQVVLETIVPELEERFPDSDTPCSLEQDELEALLYRHLHPIHASMRRDSTRRPPHPEWDVRLVPERGLVIRQIAAHAHALDPRRYSGIKNYAPLDHLDSVVSEPCSMLSIEPLLKQANGLYRPRPLDETHLSNLAGWWDGFTNPYCEYESAASYEVCCKDDAVWQSGRYRAIGGSRFYRNQILAGRSLYQLFLALRDREAHRACGLLASAVYAARLRRHIILGEDATILLPTEAALAAEADRINELLRPGRERDLVGLLADHVIPGAADVHRLRRRDITPCKSKSHKGNDSLFTARALPAEPLLASASRCGTSFSVGPFTVVMIDKVLWRGEPPSPKPNAHDAQSAPVEIPPDAVGSIVPEHRPRPPGRFHRSVTWLTERWLGRSRTPEELVRAVGRRAARPVIRVAAPLEPYARRVAGSKYVAKPRRVAGRIVRVVKRDGPKVALAKAQAMVIRKLTAATDEMGRQLSAAQHELLNEIRTLRALQADSAVLADYEAGMKSGAFLSAPLALIRKILRERNLDVQSYDLIERRLTELTKKQPRCAEAWLELGFLHEDRGNHDKAVSCFERASRSRRMHDRPTGDTHPAAVAATRCAQLLAKSGSLEQARELFVRSLTQEPYQGPIAAEYADVLRRLGRIDEAAAHYVAGMYYLAPTWSMPRASRDVRSLKLPHLGGRSKNETSPAPATTQRQPDFAHHHN
jgi:hypothetical protein